MKEGEPYERIIDLAQAEDYDLIVMGRRGVRRFEMVLVRQCNSPCDWV